jgi:3-isopropylmalate/(R)-2-methylmalate dehydratase small subunit
VDFASGKIVDETTGETFQAAPFPEFIDRIIQSGGLINSLKARGLAK